MLPLKQNLAEKEQNIMSLLLNSKRMWLLSYLICTSIALILRIFVWDTSIGKTIGVLFFEVQLVIFTFFMIIILFKWTTMCRLLATFVYLGITVYEGVAGNLSKWYIIIPVFLITEVYMLWHLGGVKNCIIACRYKNRLDYAVSLARISYSDYSNGIEAYNRNNKLGWWKKVRKKKEPNWRRIGFDSSGMEMFYFENAIFGISTDEWKRKEENLSRVHDRLKEKIKTLNANNSLHEEKESIEQIILQKNRLGIDNDVMEEALEMYDGILDENVKKTKKILRRRL